METIDEALADAYMDALIGGYQEDSSEILKILSDRLLAMSLGELDSRATDMFHGLLDVAIDQSFDTRHEPLNRFIIDSIYSKAKDLAKADKVVKPPRGLRAAWRD